MSFTRSIRIPRTQRLARWRLVAICLAMAGLLFRGLIPAGFMPTAGVAGVSGGMLMPCPGGDMAGMDMSGMQMPGMDMPASSGSPDGTAHHGSMECCPFAALAAPALLAAALAALDLRAYAVVHAVVAALPAPRVFTRVLPPPRGPPLSL